MSGPEDYSIVNLTPPALAELIEEMGGGMVQSVVIGCEVITLDGSRRYFSGWDNESSITSQIGLAHLLSKGLEHRADDCFAPYDADDENG